MSSYYISVIFEKILLSLQSGEKKKDDETVDSLGKNCFGLILSPLRKKRKKSEPKVVFLCLLFGSRSFREGTSSQRSPAGTEGGAEQEARGRRVGQLRSLPVSTERLELRPDCAQRDAS